ncbi:MAG: helix-turn-helix domain-containing protein [Bifidobacterium subtile]|nr:helix-turn-helix domain-containing protein [Bifidobacterium subtile]MCI1241462.1 helix-turn-helix domain-containing protein [Bifidobacterium subtile]
MSLARVARYCNVAPRTIQQIFRDEGTSFTRLLQQTRAEAALRLRWDQPHLTLPQIAEQCGFGSLSSLSRALRAAGKTLAAS